MAKYLRLPNRLQVARMGNQVAGLGSSGNVRGMVRTDSTLRLKGVRADSDARQRSLERKTVIATKRDRKQ